MGEAKRKREAEVASLNVKGKRMLHLLKLISKYSDREIMRFINIRKGGQNALSSNQNHQRFVPGGQYRIAKKSNS